MDRRNRHIVRDEIERLSGPLDRWDTETIAWALGNDPDKAFVGERYTGPLTAALAAAVLRGRIRRIYWQAKEPPPQPPRLVDVENIPIDGQRVNLPRLLEPLAATEIARQSGVPRSTVQRIKAGHANTSPDTAVALLRVVDDSLARELEGHLVDLDHAYRAWLAPVMEQIARDGPVRDWAVGRQLLVKLRRRLRDLDAEIDRQPDPDPELLNKRELIDARITRLEDEDDLPPRDPKLETQARSILDARRHGAPWLAGAGVDPRGDVHRAEQWLSAFGLADADEARSINAQRVYKLRARSRPR
jgi:hypothetical protein